MKTFWAIVVIVVLVLVGVYYSKKSAPVEPVAPVVEQPVVEQPAVDATAPAAGAEVPPLQ